MIVFKNIIRGFKTVSYMQQKYLVIRVWIIKKAMLKAHKTAAPKIKL